MKMQASLKSVSSVLISLLLYLFSAKYISRTPIDTISDFHPSCDHYIPSVHEPQI